MVTHEQPTAKILNELVVQAVRALALRSGLTGKAFGNEIVSGAVE